MTEPATAASARTEVRRGARNARYERSVLHAIVDESYVCQIAFSDERGVHCIPTACWRDGEHLYIHGSNGSRMVRRLLDSDCCVNITHLDGLVLARSAFHHSMLYRSAVIYGRFERIDGEDARRAALEAFMEKLAPGRQSEVRPGSDKEYAATTVLRLSLREAACKVRTGGPNDDEEDMTWPAWAGVLPFARKRVAPVPHEACSVAPPAYVLTWQDA